MDKSLQQNENAVSPVIGAILMLAIGVTILTTVQLNFIPVWNTQEELDHIQKMFDDFKELKSSIDSTVQSGTTSSLPVRMGFKYSPKFLVYNPKDSAFVSLEVKENTWAEVRYNEIFPDGMTDETSIKNVTTSTITYALMGQKYNSFIYEHGIIRRSSSNFSSSSQVAIANGTIYLLSVKPLGPETISGIEIRSVNIYPTSQQKNSVIGKNIWFILHTKPEYVNWWNDSIRKGGGEVKLANNNTGIVIAYIDTSVIKMGEAFLSTTSQTAPQHAKPYRVVKITPDNTYLPVDGFTTLVAEVQDRYNNPVPNVKVIFSKNESIKLPANANATATLIQTEAISGTDGRASVVLKTSGAGFYYIDAIIDATASRNSTTFAFPASSQGYSLSLSYSGSGPNYTVNAELRDGLGNLKDGTVYFDTSDGNLSSYNVATVSGVASTLLNSSQNASYLSITGIKADLITNTTASITWDVVNNITITAITGNVFNYNVTSTKVKSSGCVHYGTIPGNYIYTSPINCFSIINSTHNVSLTNLLPDTAYYFIVNSSRPNGTNVNSTEYMFVTLNGVPPSADTTPPASITNLTNATYMPMQINWTWTDPADPDFKEVEVYIDGNSSGVVTKGVQSFNSSYFKPNSSHTISTHTRDTSGNLNATWINWTASTPSLFTYVFDFLNLTGTVTNFAGAQNASDGGATANLSKVVSLTNQGNRTMNPAKTTTTGTQSGSYTPSNITSKDDGAIDITIPATSGTTVTTGYLMDTVKTGVGGTTYWNINTTNSIASNIITQLTLPNTDNKYYIFKPGSNNPTEGTPGAIPAGYGWISSTPIGGITSTGAWNFSVKTKYSVGNGNGKILLYVYKYNATNGNNTFLFNVTGTSNHLGTTAGTIEIITSSNQPGHVFNSDEYLKVEYWINVISGGTNNKTLTFEANTATQYVQYYKNNYYSLNTTYTFIEKNSSSIWQSISINDTSYADALANVSIFNATSGRWESILTSTFTGGNSPVEHVNVTKGANGNASSYDAGGGQIKIRYNWTNSIFNNNLSVDMINVTVFYINSTFLLNIITNTTNIPESNRSELQLKYNVSGDNFTVQIMNTSSGWENATILNTTGMPYRNITLNSSWLIPDGAFSGNVASINRSYISVRYLGINQSVNGSIYLDYQRVYST